MSGEQHEDDARHVGVWVVATLATAVGAVGGWLWARTRRDRLVAEAGTVAHAEDAGSVPDDGESASAVAEPRGE